MRARPPLFEPVEKGGFEEVVVARRVHHAPRVAVTRAHLVLHDESAERHEPSQAWSLTFGQPPSTLDWSRAVIAMSVECDRAGCRER